MRRVAGGPVATWLALGQLSLILYLASSFFLDEARALMVPGTEIRTAGMGSTRLASTEVQVPVGFLKPAARTPWQLGRFPNE